MGQKKLSFEEFTKAIADLKIDDVSARPTAHTSAVVDFNNWDNINRGAQTPASK